MSSEPSSHPPSGLHPDLIDDLCNHYREAEQTRAVLFEICDVRVPASPERRPISPAEIGSPALDK